MQSQLYWVPIFLSPLHRQPTGNVAKQSVADLPMVLRNLPSYRRCPECSCPWVRRLGLADRCEVCGWSSDPS